MTCPSYSGLLLQSRVWQSEAALCFPMCLSPPPPRILLLSNVSKQHKWPRPRPKLNRYWYQAARPRSLQIQRPKQTSFLYQLPSHRKLINMGCAEAISLWLCGKPCPSLQGLWLLPQSCPMLVLGQGNVLLLSSGLSSAPVPVSIASAWLQLRKSSSRAEGELDLTCVCQS